MKYKIATPERVREWKARRKFIQENDVKASVFMKCHKFVKTAEASKRAASAATSASDFAVRIAASAMRSYVIFVLSIYSSVHSHTITRHICQIYSIGRKRYDKILAPKEKYFERLQRVEKRRNGQENGKRRES